MARLYANLVSTGLDSRLPLQLVQSPSKQSLVRPRISFQWKLYGRRESFHSQQGHRTKGANPKWHLRPRRVAATSTLTTNPSQTFAHDTPSVLPLAGRPNHRNTSPRALLILSVLSIVNQHQGAAILCEGLDRLTQRLVASYEAKSNRRQIKFRKFKRRHFQEQDRCSTKTCLVVTLVRRRWATHSRSNTPCEIQ